MSENITNSESLPDGIIERYENPRIGVSTFGKPFNARLLFSTPTRAEDLYPGTEQLRARLLDNLAVETNRYGATDIFVPRVDKFNASLTESSGLKNTESELLLHEVSLHRSDDASFFHDGVILHPGEAAFIITGDCHTIVAWSDNRDEPVIASHAGRNSLHTINHTHSTACESVVYEILKKYSDPTSVHIRVLAGIGKETFTHPLDHATYAQQNQELVHYFAQFGAADPSDVTGSIDIATAIANQFVTQGVPDRQIAWDKIDTATDNRFWSNRRDGKPRNGVLVCAKIGS